jgi:hypothetical protein
MQRPDRIKGDAGNGDALRDKHRSDAAIICNHSSLIASISSHERTEESRDLFGYWKIEIAEAAQLVESISSTRDVCRLHLGTQLQKGRVENVEPILTIEKQGAIPVANTLNEELSAVPGPLGGQTSGGVKFSRAPCGRPVFAGPVLWEDVISPIPDNLAPQVVTESQDILQYSAAAG